MIDTMMRPARDPLTGAVGGTLDVLSTADLDAADRDAVAGFVKRSAELRSWLDAFDVRCVRRTTELADRGRSEPAESLIAEVGLQSARQSRLVRLRAESCDLFALFERALTAGEVGAGHVDALSMVIRDLNDEQCFCLIDREERLVEAARRMRVDDFVRYCRVQSADVIAELARITAAACNGAPEHASPTAEPVGADGGCAEPDTSGTGATGTGEPGSNGSGTGAPGMGDPGDCIHPGAMPDGEASSEDNITGRPDGTTGSVGAGASSGGLDPLVVEYLRQRDGSKFRRWRDLETGMCMTLLALDPIRDAVFKKAFDAHLNALRAEGTTNGMAWPQVQVEVFMRMVAASVQPQARPAGSARPSPSTQTDSNGVKANGAGHPTTAPSPDPSHSPGSRAPAAPTLAHLSDLRAAADGEVSPIGADADHNVPEVCVVATLERLLDDCSRHGLCETSDGQVLAAATLRRMLCDAVVYPTVLGGTGEVLDSGRAQRTVNRKQRRALRAMHRTCAHPGCTVPFESCRIHHVRWWTRDRGPTDLANLLPLCETHHHLVHEGGWTLTMTPARVATWIRPDGTHWKTVNTADRGADLLDEAAMRASRTGPGG